MIKVYSATILLVILALSGTIAQTPYWMQQANGSGNDEAWDIAAHQSNYYITGYYSNPTQFGLAFLQSQQAGEAFVAKLDQHGEYLWARRIGGVNTDRGVAVSVMPNGNVVAAGHFVGLATVGNLSVTSASNSQDIYVACFNANGDVLWFKRFGNQGIDVVSDIKTDAENNILLTGQFIGTLLLGSETFISGTDPQTGNATYDIFLSKLDSNGDVLWARHGKSNKNNRSGKIAIGQDNSVFLSGNFTDTLTLVNVYQNNSLNMGFVARFNASGGLQWFRRVQSSNSEIADIAYKDSLLYLTGSYAGIQRFANDETTNAWQSAPLSPFPNRYYYAAYHINGTLSFAFSEGSESSVKPKAIAALNNGSIAIAGEFSCAHTQYQQAYANGLYISRGLKDIFISEYSASGSLLRAKQIGGVGEDEVNAMTVNSFGKPVIAGSFTHRIASPAKNAWGAKPWYSFFNHSGNPLSYCNDSEYNFYAVLLSKGNKDILIANVADETRSTLDIFKRSPGDCNRAIVSGSLQVVNPVNNPCGQKRVVPEPATANALINGINYGFYWNGGNQSLSSFIPSATGLVTLHAVASNTCYSYTDSVHVTVAPLVPNATIQVSGAQVINVSPTASCPNVISPQPGASITLLGNTVSSQYITQWVLPNGSISTANPIAYIPQSYGTYTYQIIDPVSGCIRTACVRFVETSTAVGGGSGGGTDVPPNATLHFMNEDRLLNNGDTLKGCVGDSLNLKMVILLDDTLILPVTVQQFGYWSKSNNNIGIETAPSFGEHEKDIQLNTDEFNNGLTIIKIEFSPGVVDSMIWSFSAQYYIHIYPQPTINYSITGDLAPVCPGDTARYTINTSNYFELELDFTNIIETENPLSFYTLFEQTYFITFRDTTPFGCIAEESSQFSMSYIPAPTIAMNPASGIICDGQPVALSIPGITQVVWIGPSGETVSTQPVYFTDIPGFYYAVVVGINDCPLITNTVNVRNRSSFGYEVTPGVICLGQSAEVSLFALQEDNIAWLPPLSGSDLYQIISQPGNYQFIAPVCGVIDTFDVFIQGPEYLASINFTADTTLCFGDTLLLTSLQTSGVSLTWLNDYSTEPTYAVTGSGEYILQLIDQYSCTSFDTVNVTVVSIPDAPILPGPLSYCNVDSVALTSPSGVALNWYLDDTLVATSSSFVYSSAQFGQTLYVANVSSSTGCGSEKVPFPIKIKQKFEIAMADTAFALCQGEDFYLNFSPATHNVSGYQFYGPPGPNGFWVLLSTNTGYLIENLSPLNNGIYHLVVRGDTSQYCLPDTVRILILVKPLPQLSISASAPAICDGQPVTFWTQGSPSIVQSSWSFLYFINFHLNADTLHVADFFPTLPTEGIYTVIYRATFANGCQIELFLDVPIGTTPPTTIYYDTLLVACSGNPVNLTLPNAQSALWFLGNNPITSQPVNSIVYNPTFNDPPLVVYNTANYGACPSPATTIPIQVKPRVDVPNFTNIGLCPGVSTQIFYNPEWNVGLYYWKDVTADTIIATNQNLIDLPPIVNQYGLFAFPNEIGCGADSSFFSVFVYPLPTLTVNPFPNDTICLNNGALYQSATSFSVASSRVFLNGSTIPINQCFGCSTHQFLMSAASAPGLIEGQNTLLTRVQTNNDCIVLASDTFTVLSTTAPNFTIPGFNVCIGDTIFIQPSNPGMYDWVQTNSYSYLTDAALGLPTAYNVYGIQMPSIHYAVADANPTLFINSVDPITLCRSDFVEIPIQIKPDLIMPGFVNQGICANDSLLLTFSPSVNLIGTYQWLFPDGSMGVDSVLLINGQNLNQMGTYALTAQASSLGCGSDTLSFTLEIFPIPTVELITDSLHFCTHRDWVLQANITGTAQLVWNYHGLSSSSNPLTLNMPQFPDDSLWIEGVFTTPDGCIVRENLMVAVYPTPATPSFIFPSIICASDNVVFTLNNNITPDQQIHYQSNVPFVQLGNQFYYNSQGQDSEIQFVSYIQTSHCTSDTVSSTFTVNPLPVFNLGKDTMLFCFGQGTVLEGPPGYANYLWSTGATTESIEVFETGIYTLMVTDALGCLFSSDIYLLGDWPLFQLESDSIKFCLGDRVEIAAPTGFAQYLWNTGATQPSINITASGEYILVITDKNGCTYSDTLYAEGGLCEVIEQPNVFTPNGDGYNDKFTLNPFGMIAYKMVVFNRWGQLIKEVSSKDGGWDGRDKNGRDMPSGVYFYVAEVNYINKSNQELKGTIHLLNK